MDEAAKVKRVRLLRHVRETGKIPMELVPSLVEGALAELAQAERRSPAECIAMSLSDEVDHWMTRRLVTQRTISASRRSVSRALKGQPLTTTTIADIADALGCDAVVTFYPREAGGAYLAPKRP